MRAPVTVALTCLSCLLLSRAAVGGSTPVDGDHADQPAALATAVPRGALSVPKWFVPDPDDPSAIFSAGRNLSTQDAVLYWGAGWHVAAGVLQDKHREPIRHALLTVSYHDGIRSYSARLKTDANGYFIIYSPVGKTPPDPGQYTFRAARGYPFTQAAVRFAAANRNLVTCGAQIVPVAEGRHFYILTAPDQRPYDQQAHRAFAEKEQIDWAARPRHAFTTQPSPREGRVDGLRTTYTVQVVSPDGVGVAGAVVHYTAYDGVVGNNQAVATDEVGMATLVEVLATDKKPAYYDKVRRYVAVNIPGQAVGPVPFNFDPDGVNVIATGHGGRVSGQVVDDDGEPLMAHLAVRYVNPTIGIVGFGTTSGPDGRFTIDRLMPGEPFRIQVQRPSHQSTPMPEVWSDPMTLDEAQLRKDLILKAPKPAAIRGVVVDGRGQAVEGIWNLTFHNDHGAWSHGEPADGRFGSYAISPGPLRIEVRATGFEPYMSEELLLKPGEMTFVEVVMQRQSFGEDPAAPTSGDGSADARNRANLLGLTSPHNNGPN